MNLLGPDLKSPLLNSSFCYQQTPLESSFDSCPSNLSTNPPIFDPYQVPPDLIQAENHGKARKIGKLTDNPKKACPCCGLPLEKTPFSLLCGLHELAFMGSAFPFYFYFGKKVMLIVFTILFFSGTMRLALINDNCNESCVTFFGFGVLNLENYHEQIFSQSGLDTIFSLFLIVFMLGIKSRCFGAIKDFNDKAISARDYTIMVQNLPTNTKKKELFNYFRELAQRRVEKVNLAYDLKEYNANFKRKLMVVSQLKALKEEEQALNEDTLAKIIALEEENKKLEKAIEEIETKCELESSELFTGTAFITFKSQRTVRVLIDQWGVSLFRTLEHLFLKKIAEPYLKFQGVTIIVHEAPDPSDVIWENLRFSLLRKVLDHTLLYLLTGAILVGSFYIQFKVVILSNQIKEGLEEELEVIHIDRVFVVQIAALGISSITIMINFCLKLTVFMFSVIEKPYSYSKFNQSYVTTYILLAFFNSALVPYLVNTFVTTSHSSEQLIWDIHLILLSNALSTPLSKPFDPKLWLKKLMRIYIRYKGKKCHMTQYTVNQWFENTTMDIAENYAYITRTLLLAVWYSSVAPLGLIYCLFGLLMNYWLDKYLLLRVYSFPLCQSEEIIYKFINNLELIPYLYMYGAIEYHSRIMASENLLDWVWSFLFYGISSVSLSVCLVVYMVFFKHRTQARELRLESYEDVRLLMVAEYDRVNPITRKKSNKEFMENLEKYEGLSPLQKKNIMRRVAIFLPHLPTKKPPSNYWSPLSHFKQANINKKPFEIEMLPLSADLEQK